MLQLPLTPDQLMFAQKQALICAEHFTDHSDKNTLQLVCLTCGGRPICTSCTAATHKGHTYEKIVVS